MAVLACAKLMMQLPFAAAVELAVIFAAVQLAWRLSAWILGGMAARECAYLCSQQSPAVVADQQRGERLDRLKRCAGHVVTVLLSALWVHQIDSAATGPVASCLACILILPNAYDAWWAGWLASLAQRAAEASSGADSPSTC